MTQGKRKESLVRWAAHDSDPISGSVKALPEPSVDLRAPAVSDELDLITCPPFPTLLRHTCFPIYLPKEIRGEHLTSGLVFPLMEAQA